MLGVTISATCGSCLTKGQSTSIQCSGKKKSKKHSDIISESRLRPLIQGSLCFSLLHYPHANFSTHASDRTKEHIHYKLPEAPNVNTSLPTLLCVVSGVRDRGVHAEDGNKKGRRERSRVILVIIKGEIRVQTENRRTDRQAEKQPQM